MGLAGLSSSWVVLNMTSLQPRSYCSCFVCGVIGMLPAHIIISGDDLHYRQVKYTSSRTSLCKQHKGVPSR
ncbi:hypothetical protein B0H66DRAFT_558338 [Apodospora peruviana]|uniref:Uncharacterized protein n=1 Tax=Apodospora peruviana TaxID=516989 RepID=A0AAE0I5H9_9PEZI|nr:hypothetical protein B0H66DRAFT_558338 [Apodospora peruviana]